MIIVQVGGEYPTVRPTITGAGGLPSRSSGLIGRSWTPIAEITLLQAHLQLILAMRIEYDQRLLRKRWLKTGLMQFSEPQLGGFIPWRRSWSELPNALRYKVRKGSNQEIWG